MALVYKTLLFFHSHGEFCHRQPIAGCDYEESLLGIISSGDEIHCDRFIAWVNA